jgi:hypothetical protein
MKKTETTLPALLSGTEADTIRDPRSAFLVQLIGIGRLAPEQRGGLVADEMTLAAARRCLEPANHVEVGKLVARLIVLMWPNDASDLQKRLRRQELLDRVFAHNFPAVVLKLAGDELVETHRFVPQVADVLPVCERIREQAEEGLAVLEAPPEWHIVATGHMRRFMEDERREAARKAAIAALYQGFEDHYERMTPPSELELKRWDRLNLPYKSDLYNFRAACEVPWKQKYLPVLRQLRQSPGVDFSAVLSAFAYYDNDSRIANRLHEYAEQAGVAWPFKWPFEYPPEADEEPN